MAKLLSVKRLSVLAGIVLAMILTISMLPIRALANDSLQTQAALSGDCGTDCTYTLDTQSGALSITALSTGGTLMSVVDATAFFPWTSTQNSTLVKTANIGSGVAANGGLDGLFQACSNMTQANLEYLDTTNATIMGNMFYGCSSLNTLVMPITSTPNATDMSNMFNGCKQLKTINVSKLDTTNVQYMMHMFNNCSSLEELDLRSFNTQNVLNMQGMFNGCDSLKTVKVGSLFSFKGQDGNGCTLPGEKWLCVEDGKVYTPQEIADKQGAFTYTRVDDSENPGMPTPDNPSSGNNNSGSNNNNNSSGTTGGINVYRLYNPNNGDHFYTADVSERNWLSTIGWRYEGIAWVGPGSGAEVYRMYNPNNGDHFYTTSASERDWMRTLGWRYEGVSWYSADSSATPLYRLYNPYAKLGCHLWTADKSERDWLVRDIGWVAEDVGWYVLSTK